MAFRSLQFALCERVFQSLAAVQPHIHKPLRRSPLLSLREFSAAPGTGDNETEEKEQIPPAVDAVKRQKVKRLTRQEKGDYNDAEFTDELEAHSVSVPRGLPVYDLRELTPFLARARSKPLQLLKHLEQHHPEAFADFQVPLEQPPRPGARQILHWETRMNLDPGGAPVHPVNRKVRCAVYLRDLQAEAGLSEAALRHVAHVCGPRYDRGTGKVTLTCEKYAHREDNRREIMDILHALVEEGHRAYPATAAVAEKQ